MGTRVVDHIDSWTEQSFDGGYEGLQQLVDRDFSGVVRAGGTELYMTRGVAVGIRYGEVTDFESAAGTALAAPAPALPLLAVMQEHNDGVRDEFYSEQTPLSEVDETLASGGFSGYVELSENVLSGDYYVVYHRGRSMAVAFVGQSKRLESGEAAFELADDEVGIYQVRPASVDHIELPDPGATGETDGATGDAAAGDGRGATGQTGSGTGTRPGGEAGTESVPETDSPSRPGTEPAPQPPADTASQPPDRGQAQPRAEVSDEPPETGPAGAADGVPAEQPDDGPAQQPDTTPKPPAEEGATQPRTEAAETGRSGQVARLRGRLAEREAEMERLRAELDERTEERAQLRSQLETVRAEREALASEVEELEAELDRLEREFGVARSPERDISPAEALAGTDLFVRYHDKSGVTLESAKEGAGERDELRENLRLERHTAFDESVVGVEGRTYDAFLEDSLAFQFVEWVVADLVFEIRESGGQSALADLDAALPNIDRVELDGRIRDGPADEDGAEVGLDESFDVVFRNRAGTPLLVATLHESDTAVTRSVLERTLTAAEAVGEGVSELAGAFVVTRSFFEPAAMDLTREATRSGFLSRDSRESFVNTARKEGYHLALVEARDGRFDLVVPEL